MFSDNLLENILTKVVKGSGGMVVCKQVRSSFYSRFSPPNTQGQHKVVDKCSHCRGADIL